MGTRDEDDSTNAIDPPGSNSGANVRANRTAPRNTDSNAARHCSSVADVDVPAGGPPTLTSSPSTRPYASRATLSNRPGVSSSALSHAAPTAPSSAAADETVDADRPVNTTRAPSATSADAVAKPSPLLPPVTTYTRSRSPRSMPSNLVKPDENR